MRLVTCICLLTLSCATVRAEDFKASTPTNGLVLKVWLEDGAGVLSSSKEIQYQISTDDSQIHDSIFYLKREYSCRLQLSDEAGKNVLPSKTGKEYGRKFSGLTIDSSDAVERISTSGTGANRPKMALVSEFSHARGQLPPPEVLFNIGKPGHYILKLELQVFEQRRNGTNVINSVLRFSPILIPLLKEAPKTSAP
jgi:hypothetical protein